MQRRMVMDKNIIWQAPSTREPNEPKT